MMFDWKPEYNVGVPQIDAQHLQLFVMAADLHSAMLARQGKAALAGLLERLLSYTRNHFATEETLMQHSRYSGYAAHKAEHDALTERVLAFQAGFAAGRVAITLEIMQFLKDWLSHHIAGTDRSFGTHLRARAA